MIADGTYTAVVDRIEVGADGERLAVLLLEDGEEGGADEGDVDQGSGDEVVGDLVVERDRLPEDAREDGAVLQVVVEDGDLADARYRPDETGRRREAARSRFDRLSERPPGSDDEG